MKFFMPDWSDMVDPSFDFQRDRPSRARDTSRDVYAHEIFKTRVYDGILLSRAVVEKSPSTYSRLLKERAALFYRLDEGMEVFGDCGAFTYVNEKEPRYETYDVLQYYESIGVNYGASVDHLVVETIREPTVSDEETNNAVSPAPVAKKTMSVRERKRRVELTLENAREFIRLHRRKKTRFTVVGVAQGWTPETYAGSVTELVRMGYRYIALGGLARSPAFDILRVLWRVNQVLEEIRTIPRRSIRLHIFGVAKLGLIGKLKKSGVHSIDSASYLRKAWLRSGQNYLGPGRRWYTAIRVPQSDNPKLRDYLRSNHRSLAQARALEASCLDMLEKYDRGGLRSSQIDTLVETVVEYDRLLLRDGDDGQALRDRELTKEKYRRTLLAQPWKHCPCEVCQQLGIHVVIFRGTNRNKRRGYHNTWMFYGLLGEGNC
jgi:hypothetical protein